MMLDLTPDELLSTTRSVRKRLDLERPVERFVIEECIDLAIQAPTGSNAQGWHWVVVEDADLKRQIADHYAASFDPYIDMPGASYVEADPRAQRQDAVKSSPPTCATTSTKCRRWWSRANGVVYRTMRRRSRTPATGARSSRRCGASCSRCGPEGSARRGRRCTSLASARWRTCSASRSTSAPRPACSRSPTQRALTSRRRRGCRRARSSTGTTGSPLGTSTNVRRRRFK